MTLPAAELCHFGLYAHDLEKMVNFYTRAFGLVVTDRGRSPRGIDIAFLSGRPDEHHQLAIAAGRPADATFSTINQVSFRVGSLDDLKRYHSWLRDERVKDLETARPRQCLEHLFQRSRRTIAWRFIARRPGTSASRSANRSIWTAPSEAILAKTEAMVRQDPTSRPIEAWSADMRKRLGQPERA